MQRLRAGVSAVRGPLRGDWGDPSPPRTQTLGLRPLRLPGHLRPPWGALPQGFVTAPPPALAWAELLQTASCSPGFVTWRPVSVGQLCVQRPRDLLPEAEQGLRTCPLGSGCCCGAGPARGRHRLPCLSSTPLLIEGRACARCLRTERRWGLGFPHPGWWGPLGLSAWRCCGQDAGLGSGPTWVLLTREG